MKRGKDPGFAEIVIFFFCKGQLIPVKKKEFHLATILLNWCVHGMNSINSPEKDEHKIQIGTICIKQIRKKALSQN